MLSSLRLKLVPQVARYSSRRQLYTSYQRALERHPILVQAFQAGLLMGAGDFIAQTAIEKTKLSHVDYWRTAKFCAIGFVVAGPGLRSWYGLLDKRIRAEKPLTRTLAKVFVDQVVFAPLFLAGLVSIIGFTQHRDIDKIKTKLQNEYVDILKSNYYVWPWVQLINFRFVPLNYQVLLTQVVAVMWNIYISWRTNLSERNVKAGLKGSLDAATPGCANTNAS